MKILPTEKSRQNRDNLFKRKIILFSLIFHCGISLIAIPVNILPDSFIVDMLTVFRIKSPIIMKRIVRGTAGYETSAKDHDLGERDRS